MRIIAATGFLVGIAAFLWLGVGSQSSTPVSAGTFQIQVGDFWFCNSSFQDEVCPIEIDIGDSVTWLFEPTSFLHTTTECTGACGTAIGDPDSRLWHQVSTTSDTFERTFDLPGTFEYQCNIHPTRMRSTIIVGGGVPGLLGDVNGDGMISSIDAALILQFTAGFIDSLPNADVNEDGTINSIDAALVLQFTAGLIGTLPP